MTVVRIALIFGLFTFVNAVAASEEKDISGVVRPIPTASIGAFEPRSGKVKPTRTKGLEITKEKK